MIFMKNSRNYWGRFEKIKILFLWKSKKDLKENKYFVKLFILIEVCIYDTMIARYNVI